MHSPYLPFDGIAEIDRQMIQPGVRVEIAVGAFVDAEWNVNVDGDRFHVFVRAPNKNAG